MEEQRSPGSSATSGPPFAGRWRKPLDEGEGGGNEAGRLGAPSGNPGDAVGIVSDQGEPIWNRRRLDTELGAHSVLVDLQLPPPIDGQDIDFDVDLSQDEDFNWAVGTHMTWGEAWEATVEVGSGDRQTALANITYRFE